MLSDWSVNNKENNAFLDKNKNHKTYKALPEPGIVTGTSCTAVWSVTSRPPSRLNVSIEVKLFNCFNVMGPNKPTTPDLRVKHL